MSPNMQHAPEGATHYHSGMGYWYKILNDGDDVFWWSAMEPWNNSKWLRSTLTLSTLTGTGQLKRLVSDVVVENKYNRQLKGVTVDVYDVLKAFEVTCPALQHLIKKALCAGLRGHKDATQDLQDIIDSAIRAKELHDENMD